VLHSKSSGGSMGFLAEAVGRPSLPSRSGGRGTGFLAGAMREARTS
jgi:hypothetical protein